MHRSILLKDAYDFVGCCAPCGRCVMAARAGRQCAAHCCDELLDECNSHMGNDYRLAGCLYGACSYNEYWAARCVKRLLQLWQAWRSISAMALDL